MDGIDSRLKNIQDATDNSNSNKRRCSLELRLIRFLLQLPNKPDLSSVQPQDICRFLVWCDKSGKTQVHRINCQYVGAFGIQECGCPCRLSAGTVQSLIQQLVDIFCLSGRGRSWDIRSTRGNPAMAPCVKQYGKSCKIEQAKAHVMQKQAKPLFLGKIKTISSYIDREISRTDISLREKFVLSRDQALFKLQFFAGDRASDMCNVLTQEIKKLSDGSGYVFNHTYGKSLRGDGKCNTFVIKKCEDITICPVEGLNKYYKWAKEKSVDLRLGYLFRPVSESGRVLDQQLGYTAIYERLKSYLTILGINEGETPHSLRHGFAVSMAVSGHTRSSQTSNESDIIPLITKHVGWSNESTANYYARTTQIKDASVTAQHAANLPKQTNAIEQQFKSLGDYQSLDAAFQCK